MIGAISAGALSSIGPAVAKATGGNEIKQVGVYWYHIFTSSGTFTPLESLTLAVTGCGGGGGGAANAAGAGGGAELDINTSVSATATAYTVTVGALGAGATGNTGSGSQGGTSLFAKTSPATNYVTSLGGGNGVAGGTAGTGGSGGGAGAGGTGGAAFGSNTFAGGAGAATTNAAGGGGGATAVGVAGSDAGGLAIGGNGGLGYALATIDANLTAANFTSFTGMTVLSSGGGGAALDVRGGSTGATRGLGGTGAGNGGQDTLLALQFAATSGTSFGAGGGGGGWSSGAGNFQNKPAGSGYGGVVIVRYPV